VSDAVKNVREPRASAMHESRQAARHISDTASGSLPVTELALATQQ
jgi:hypothetical protein